MHQLKKCLHQVIAQDLATEFFDLRLVLCRWVTYCNNSWTNFMTRDVNRKPEIRFSVLKPKSGIGNRISNLFFYIFTYGKVHKDEKKFLKRLIHAFA